MQRRERIAEIREAMDVPSGNFLVRICLIVALTNAVGEMAEKISSRCRFWREGDNAKIVGKKSIKRDDRKENTKHY